MPRRSRYAPEVRERAVRSVFAQIPEWKTVVEVLWDGNWMFEAIYQGNPVPRECEFFSRATFRYWRPRGDQYVLEGDATLTVNRDDVAGSIFLRPVCALYRDSLTQ